MLRERQDIGRVISQEHFQLLYEGCHHTVRPAPNPEQWWQALLTFGMTTGWRISEILSLCRDDLDLETGVVVTRAKDNKGGRTDTDRLPDVTVEHLRSIASFEPLVFHWPHDRRTLLTDFHRLQRAVGVHLTCPGADEHKCTTSCHCYGFHALRRGYATYNVDMGLPVLQRKMRHRSAATTQRYIELREKVNAAADDVFVPGFLRGTRSAKHG